MKERAVKKEPYLYVLPKEGDMLVEGKMFLSEALFENVENSAIEQVRNVACLPGVKGASLGMPDMHVGYGFTVGGIAAFDTKDGVISPGGVGFDINCISKDATVLSRDGYTQTIEELYEREDQRKLVCLDVSSQAKDAASPVVFMRKKTSKQVYQITTETGRELLATGDHPLYTKEGMVAVSQLKERLADELYVATSPFSGVAFEQPSSDVLVSELKWLDAQAISFLQQRNLLPLHADNPHVPALLRIMGFLFGDGTLQSTKKTVCASFYGKKDDLELIRADVLSLGVTPSRVYSRDRAHAINTQYGQVCFESAEHSFHVRSKALVALLAALGVPTGNKTSQEYQVPGWIFSLPLWMQRNFLAALFGAEMSTPSTLTQNHSTFYMPCLSMNKTSAALASGKQFLAGIAQLLDGFDVRTAPISERKSYLGTLGQTHTLRLFINADSFNLINLYQYVGFEYHQEKQKLGNCAIHYLALKEAVITERYVAQKTALIKKELGVPTRDIVSSLVTKNAHEQFLLHAIHKKQLVSVRPPKQFMAFEQFVSEYAVGDSGFVWDEIISIEPVRYDDFVYDLTMGHASHNFVANNLLISNCGVRVLATDLDVERVEPLIDPLLELLFQKVPAGVGLKSSIRLSNDDLDEVLTTGAQWALKNGFALAEDLSRTEENGCFAEADPSKLSSSARKRGLSQLGTLGAGNHFLEVQVVDDILDEAVAERFGITRKGQIVVMIHCGSRGVGHQVCTDFLRRIEQEHPDIMASLPEKNLAYAPASSPAGRDYYGAMCASANFAFANRQVIAHRVREAFTRLFPGCNIRQVYDIAHNIAKREVHVIDGKEMEVFVHRKGATRAFPPGRPEICEEYRDVGQPVLIPGSMGTASYILVGTEKAMQETFGSSAHGAGRLMSRTQAKKEFRGERVASDLLKRNITVKAASMMGVAEEAPMVYKDVDEVIRVTEQAGIARAVVRVIPLGVVKG
jgi:tRNA-splicing ligase RtcB (3'-phosphate/5'-hydroxy nucleic acid ligase)